MRLLPAIVLTTLLFAPLPCRADPSATLSGGRIVLSSPLAFESHGGTLDPADAPLLDAVARILRAHPTMVVEIGAHTDSRGSEDFNLAVTESVARQVRMALIARGIEASRLRAVGYGETQPIADNMSAEGRAANRRIELLVVHP